ncbi:MAG: BON domain-containing protein [Rhodocyclaceae bacterium]|nr:BON domain-containing protein [Rhodocyclaceae bacterium]
MIASGRLPSPRTVSSPPSKSRPGQDPVVSAIDVSVETTYGEVLLSGFVDNAQQAQRAREIAARVEGVKKVHDNIVVKG